MGIERRTPEHKTEAVASSKRVPRLLSAIISFYVVCSEMVLTTSYAPSKNVGRLSDIIHSWKSAVVLMRRCLPLRYAERQAVLWDVIGFAAVNESQILLYRRGMVLPSIGIEARCLCSYFVRVNHCRKRWFTCWRCDSNVGPLDTRRKP